MIFVVFSYRVEIIKCHAAADGTILHLQKAHSQFCRIRTEGNTQRITSLTQFKFGFHDLRTIFCVEIDSAGITVFQKDRQNSLLRYGYLANRKQRLYLSLHTCLVKDHHICTISVCDGKAILTHINHRILHIISLTPYQIIF